MHAVRDDDHSDPADLKRRARPKFQPQSGIDAAAADAMPAGQRDHRRRRGVRLGKIGGLRPVKLRLERLADTIRRAYEGEAWHGPSLSEVLEGIDAVAAAIKRGDAHTIWELTLHITAWLEIVRWALREFRQEALYVKVAGVPEIVGPRATIEI